MDLGIEGRVALITGGSRGLGRQCAISLASEGVNVAICGRTKDTLDTTVSELQGLGVTAVGVVTDISNTDQATALHQKVVSDIGEIDILVNNVGGSLVREDITGTSTNDLRMTLDLNLFGGYELMQLVLPHMRKQQWGRIINIASIWGREHGGHIGYMTSKAALIAATKHAGVALAKDNVLVNSIAPGSVSHPGGSWDGRSTTRSKQLRSASEVGSTTSSSVPCLRLDPKRARYRWGLTDYRRQFKRSLFRFLP